MSMMIFCVIDEFIANCPIYMADKDLNKYTLLADVKGDDVGHTIVTLSKEKQISDVLLSGASEAYLERFVDDIYTINNLMYNGTHEIKVSIIKGEI